jgi:hypothetical protein
MTARVASHRTSADRLSADPGPVVPLLLFEAAGGAMALPAVEVTRLAGPTGPAVVPEAGDVVAIDLGEHFGAPRSAGPWLLWTRGDRRLWLRVERVAEVISCAIRTLAPMPARLRVAGGARVFWAAGVRDDEVFLLLDPAQFEERQDV